MAIGATRIHLRDLATIQARSPFRGPIAAVRDGSVRAVQMKDLHEDGIRWDDVVRTELPARRKVSWLEAGDILFAGRGASFYAGCIADPPGPAVCSPHLFQIRLLPSAPVLPEFVAWQLNQPLAQAQIREAAAGTTQLNIRRPALEAVALHVPDVAVQHTIMALVRAARRECELLQALIRARTRELQAIAIDLAHAPA